MPWPAAYSGCLPCRPCEERAVDDVRGAEADIAWAGKNSYASALTAIASREARPTSLFLPY